jgi:hypothetical protein
LKVRNYGKHNRTKRKGGSIANKRARSLSPTNSLSPRRHSLSKVIQGSHKINNINIIKFSKSFKHSHALPELTYEELKSIVSEKGGASRRHLKNRIYEQTYIPRIHIKRFTWPDGCGCVANISGDKPLWNKIILTKGTILSRFGKSSGGFLGNEIDSYSARGLPFIVNITDYNRVKDDDIYKRIENKSPFKFHRYKVLKDFPMLSCEASPITIGDDRQVVIGHGKQYFMLNDIDRYINMSSDQVMALPNSTFTMIPIQSLIDDDYLEELYDLNSINYPPF